MSVATLGRIKKIDIERSIGKRISDKTVLCSDSHQSYKGFAIDKALEHHTIKVKFKEYVKDGVYHVQHANSLHNKLKKWLNNEFWGVSTKHLQQYLNWFRMKEALKNSAQPAIEFANKTVLDVDTCKRYREIDPKFKLLIASLD